ncbi:pseudouridine synthase [Halorussus salilacus]|uniref:PUA domain-containing protein n=1 Tax=Halorussus salilacus TaxID=2953750 RepID=UPI0020A16467|nr:PUA domain-containing protein [Halorussus salilacus]USZ69040.1 pseudouridine synthase [Halorussus salilacus]
MTASETDEGESPPEGARGTGPRADDDLPALRTTADYQFGAGAGGALFPEGDDLRVERSSSGRPQQVIAEDGRLVTYGTDGRFTLGLAGGRRLLDALDAPAGRVVVGDESEPFVREGKNVFAKFVAAVGPEVRPGDELAVVHEDGRLLAVGRAELSADAMRDFDTGMAVMVREGAGDAE